MFSSYQLKVADFYNIPIDNVNKLVFNFFDKENYVQARIKAKKVQHALEFNQSQ